MYIKKNDKIVSTYQNYMPFKIFIGSDEFAYS